MAKRSLVHGIIRAGQDVATVIALAVENAKR